MAKIVCRKNGRTLTPVDDEGRDALAKIRDGRDVMVEVRRARNPRHHRLYWALINFVKLHAINADGESLFENADLEIIHTAVKIATGFVRTFVDTTTGKTAFVPLSIAFESLDQTQFEEFFNTATKIIASRWLPPGTTPEDVRRELIELVDGPHALGERVA